MRDLKDMFDQLHPEESMKKQTLEKMQEKPSRMKYSSLRKVAIATVCLVLCSTSVFLIQNNQPMKQNQVASSEEKYKENGNSKTKDIDDPVTPYTIKYAKAVAEPRAYSSYENYDRMEKLDQVNTISSHSLCPFYEETIPQLLDKKENTVYSPLSLLYVLGMLDQSLDGEGKQELEEYVGLTQEEMASYLSLFAIRNQEEGNMFLSNSIWINKENELHEDVLQEIADTYDASSYLVEFGKQEAVDEINEYVYSKTNGMIDLDLQADPREALLLLNVIALQSEWSNDFTKDKEITEFTLENKKTISTDFIKGTDTHGRYAKEEQYEVTDLPLANGYSMRVVLPDENTTVDQLINDPEQLNTIIHQRYEEQHYNVTIHMPKFTMASDYNFNDMLQSSGVNQIFKNSNVFHRIGDDLIVSNVFQKAYIEVNEVGLRAASASGVQYNTTGIYEDEPEKVDMVVNRPFLYLIQDHEQNVIFIGTLYNPAE